MHGPSTSRLARNVFAPFLDQSCIWRNALAALRCVWRNALAALRREGHMTSRRVFLSGSAASLLAVPALPFAQQALSIAPQSPPPLARELKRQLQRAVKAIADQGRGEGARRVAVVLRLWAAHGVVQGYDAQM